MKTGVQRRSSQAGCSRLPGVIRAAWAGLLAAAAAACTTAAPLAELRTLSSQQGLLDILMVARPAPLSWLMSPAPTGWVYDICPRPVNGDLSCPPSADNLYGGTRLALKGGDLLKIRLVNSLPELPDAKHSKEAPYLASNPTNLHTHGLMVSPRYPTQADPTYGDNIFVLTLNPANSPLPNQDDAKHLHSDLRLTYTDYSIAIPPGHPSGIFWFHPHAHGIALNQVSAGLAGMISIGSVFDYVCANAACAAYAKTIPVRHLMLKDTQVLALDGNTTALKTQQDPQFCWQQPQPGEPGPRQGYCPGATTPVDPDDGQAYPGGRWYLTINGQPYPSIPITATQGEIWRIATGSGSNSYDLRLQDPQGRDMIMQVLSIDGVALAGPQQGSLAAWAARQGRKIDFAPCPGAPMQVAAGSGAPLCASRIVMMPSSRVELWVAYRDAAGNLASPPPGGAKATLRTVGYSTGGDDWPAVDLAQVQFSGRPRGPNEPLALSIGGSANGVLLDPRIIAAQLKAANEAVGSDPACKPLPAGHGRRIFFGGLVDPDGEEGFGLAFEEIDAFGRSVPGSYMPLSKFDPSAPSICLPLGPANTPNTEFWQLVNLSDEDHNFHIHQLRYFLLKDPSGSDELRSPNKLDGDEVAYDNLPLRHSPRPCGTVQAWRDAHDPRSPGHGACEGKPIRVAIPFAVAGDFVYHCHILEHEDGGMMASIRVRAAAVSRR